MSTRSTAKPYGRMDPELYTLTSNEVSKRPMTITMNEHLVSNFGPTPSKSQKEADHQDPKRKYQSTFTLFAGHGRGAAWMKATPRPDKAVLTQANQNSISEASKGVPKAPRPKDLRPLHALSVDEFLDLCAHHSADQIASAYGIKAGTVRSYLSDVVRAKARAQGRRRKDVKSELNLRRVAAGAIPTIDRRDGVRVSCARTGLFKVATSTATVSRGRTESCATSSRCGR